MNARTLTLRLPLPPNLANKLKGVHWATWHRKRKAYYLRALVTERALRGRPQPFREARAEIDLYLPQRMDMDNALARCKWTIDCLVRAGHLVDDKEPHLVLAGLPGQHVAAPHGVVITAPGSRSQASGAVSVRVELRIARSDAPTTDAGRAAFDAEVGVFLRYFGGKDAWEPITLEGEVLIGAGIAATFRAKAKPPATCARCGHPVPDGGLYREDLCTPCAMQAGHAEAEARMRR